MSVLIGILAFTFKDEPRYNAFNTDFSLVNDRGEPVDRSLFKGSPSLVYFGYKNCQIPRHSGGLWVDYSFGGDGPLSGWSTGAGIQAASGCTY